MRHCQRLIAIVLLMLFTASAFAANGVKDNAGMFSSNAVMEADAAIAQLKQKHGDDLLIETFPAIPDDLRAGYSDQQKQQFFLNWAQQQAKANAVDGVYVLINKDPAYLQPLVGNQTAQKQFLPADRDRLGQIMRENLRNNPDQALVQGVQFVQKSYDANVGARGTAQGQKAGAAGGAAAGAGAQRTQRPGGLFSGSCFLWLIIGGVIFLLFRVLANRNRQQAGYGPGGYGPGRYGQPGPPPYGQPGYGQTGFPTPGTTGGGFGRGLLGGLLGGMAGGYLWDKVSGRDNSAYGSPTQGSEGPAESGPDTGYLGGGGGDFGGDAGGGGDFGGGDSGGGEF